MFDIINFQSELNIFRYMFDSDIDFQKSKNDFIKNEFVKSFSDSYLHDALDDIKMTYYSKNNVFEINVSALDENIKIEYLVNLTTDEIKSNVRLFKGEYTNSDKFSKCYNAYENLNSMIIIFIQSNVKNVDSVVNTFIEKLNNDLLLRSNNIKFDNIYYNDLNDMLFIKTETFEIQVLNFTDFIKGENLYYDINSDNKVNNQTVNLVNSIVKQLENLR